MRLRKAPTSSYSPAFYRELLSKGAIASIHFMLLCLSLLLAAILLSCQSQQQLPPSPLAQGSGPRLIKPVVASSLAPSIVEASRPTRTKVVMHNVILNEGPALKLRVRWLRGSMYPTRADITPSFDDPNSFWLDIDDGVVGTSLDDLAAALNAGLLDGAPLQHVSLAPYGKQIKVSGTLHKGIPLPIEMIGDIDAAPDGRIRMHIAKLRVLKVPFKGVLNTFHLKAGDLVDPKGAKGVEVAGDDVYFDPEKILPAPRKRGKLTYVHIARGNIVEVYGSARPEVMKAKEWRNFIRLRGGTLEFGKLTMHDVDLVMIDISNDAWFKFDLAHYQEQIVRGYTRMTPQAGLEIFMPDIDTIPRNKANQSISLEWAKNRKIPPPAYVMR